MESQVTWADQLLGQDCTEKPFPPRPPPPKKHPTKWKLRAGMIFPREEEKDCLEGEEGNYRADENGENFSDKEGSLEK